jgi:hypothetical protein
MHPSAPEDKENIRVTATRIYIKLIMISSLPKKLATLQEL